MNKVFLFALLFPISYISVAQSLPGMDSTFQWRNIGPANQGGRIVDIEALDNQFRKVFMATGSGGVWYSENAGTTWAPIFDSYSTASIGDIAVYQAMGGGGICAEGPERDLLITVWYSSLEETSVV